MTTEHESWLAAMAKVLVGWFGLLVGVKLSEWVLVATLIYTLVQTYFLIKNKGKK